MKEKRKIRREDNKTSSNLNKRCSSQPFYRHDCDAMRWYKTVNYQANGAIIKINLFLLINYREGEGNEDFYNQSIHWSVGFII